MRYLFIFLFFVNKLNAQVLPSSEFVINSTIKIETIDKITENGKVKTYRSTGTGFFFIYMYEGARFVPVIVTNKHVIKDATKGLLYFKVQDSAGKFINGKTEVIEFDNFKNQWILHPDTTVDLAILPIANIINTYEKHKLHILYAPYAEINIPNDSLLNTLSAIEDIFMIGYPYGLRDKTNDLPIVRKGITATPPYLNYNSQQEFLCDIQVQVVLQY